MFNFATGSEVMDCSSIPDYTHTLDLVVALEGYRVPFSSRFPTIIPIIIINPLNSKEMNNKKKTRVGPTFPNTVCTCWTASPRTSSNRQPDEASSGERTDRAARSVSERARLEELSLPTGRRNWRCKVLTEGGLRYSQARHPCAKSWKNLRVKYREKNVESLYPEAATACRETGTPSMVTSRTTNSPLSPEYDRNSTRS